MADTDQKNNESDLKPATGANLEPSLGNDNSDKVEIDQSVCEKEQTVSPSTQTSEQNTEQVAGREEAADLTEETAKTESLTRNDTSETPKNNLPTKISDILMKRTKLSHKWERKYFELSNTILSYGDLPSNNKKESMKDVQIQDAEILESNIDNKEHAISIKPKDGKRVFYLQAQDKDQHDKWLQALCYAKVSGRKDGNSESCAIQ